VLCNGEECVTTPAAGTGGACVLKIECDENGQCKVQTGSGSCCSEGAECCETSEGATATREPVKKTAGTKAAPVELKTRKARKTKTAGSIGSL
jgi:hypothetical protein